MAWIAVSAQTRSTGGIGLTLKSPNDYGLAGPFKGLKLYKPQDWNELVVTVQNGVARATNNGEVLDVELKVPETGPIGVEGDRGQMEYRRIRIKRLPASGTPPGAQR